MRSSTLTLSFPQNPRNGLSVCCFMMASISAISIFRSRATRPAWRQGRFQADMRIEPAGGSRDKVGRDCGIRCRSVLPPQAVRALPDLGEEPGTGRSGIARRGCAGIILRVCCGRPPVEISRFRESLADQGGPGRLSVGRDQRALRTSRGTPRGQSPSWPPGKIIPHRSVKTKDRDN